MRRRRRWCVTAASKIPTTKNQHSIDNNDWPGTWDGDKELPDGTYFFILEYVDRDVEIIRRGFIEMMR